MTDGGPVRRIPKPPAGEYPPYAGTYLDLQAAISLVSALPEERLPHR